MAASPPSPTPPHRPPGQRRFILLYAIDTETYLIGRRLTPRLVCGQACNENNQTKLFNAADFVKWFEDALNAGHSFVGHNISYDLGVIMVFHDYLVELIFEALEQGRFYDTMLRETLIQNALGQRGRVNLDAVVNRRLGVAMAGKDTTRLFFSELDGVPLEEWPHASKEYALNDALLTMKVYQSQQNERAITTAGRPVIPLEDEAARIRAAVSLHLCAVWGMKTHQGRSKIFVETVNEEAAKGLEKAKGLGFLRDNGTKNMKALKALVSEAYKGDPPTTEKGAVSTSKEVLEESGHAGLQDYAKTLTAAKLASTYAPILAQASVHPRYNALVGTGRTSCRKPNLQNPPRQGSFRSCFVPRENFVYVGADYSQIELLALSQLNLWWFGSSQMAKVLQRKEDVHCHFVATLKGWTYEDTFKRHKAGDPEVKKARQMAKGVLYGLPGGLGAESLVAFMKGSGVVITVEEAAALKKEYLKTYPEMVNYFQKASKLTQWGDATIVHPISNRQRGGLNYNQCLNTPFQGLCADGALAALWAVTRACFVEPESPLAGCHPCLFLHDEIMLECPIGQEDAAAAELSRLMVQEMARFIPDIPIEAEPQISTEWVK